MYSFLAGVAVGAALIYFWPKIQAKILDLLARYF